MRKVEAILEPEWFQGVMDALAAARLGVLHVTQLARFDPARHPNQTYRGAPYSVGESRLKIELLVDDDRVERAIAAIRHGVDSQSERDFELAVFDVEYAHQPRARIRSTRAG